MGRSVAGVDDAGRGPIIGPLIIAGVLMDEDEVPALVSMGVKDSKLLTPESRSALAVRINEIATKVSYDALSPAEIDEVVLKGKRLQRLNLLEARSMGKVIADLKPAAVWVDASDVKPERYARQILDSLPAGLRRTVLISEHKADRRYPIVSAASIMAKVRRDAAISALWEEYGNFGSGYVTDPETIKFLKEWRKSHDSYPPIVRKSWRTLKEIESEIGQTRLTGPDHTTGRLSSGRSRRT
jgi:ribonuclease HII